MKLRYQVTLEDVLAFNRYHYGRSPGSRHTLVRVIVLSVILAALTILLDAFSRQVVLSPVGIAFAIIYPVIVAFWLPVARDRLIRRWLAEGRNRCLICEHELELTDSGVVDRTAVSESRMTWAGIERIATAPGYLFVYIGASQAHVVPRRGLREGDFDAFGAALQATLAAHADNAPIDATIVE